MHFHNGRIPEEYRRYVGRKVAFLIVLTILLAAALVVAVSLGAANVPVPAVIKSLLGMETTRQTEIIVWNIRLPQALASMVAGAGLAVAGAAMQSILRNPLGSPYTLGISNAGAFGAAVSVILLGTGQMHSTAADAVRLSNPYLTTVGGHSYSASLQPR